MVGKNVITKVSGGYDVHAGRWTQFWFGGDAMLLRLEGGTFTGARRPRAAAVASGERLERI